MPEKITLSGVPETMLQTLYARARESQGRGVIQDKKAEELIARLDYDFTLAEKDTAMRSGVIARTLVLDQLVGDWLRQHPGAVVVVPVDDKGNIHLRAGHPLLPDVRLRPLV